MVESQPSASQPEPQADPAATAQPPAPAGAASQPRPAAAARAAAPARPAAPAAAPARAAERPPVSENGLNAEPLPPVLSPAARDYSGLVWIAAGIVAVAVLSIVIGVVATALAPLIQQLPGPG